VERRRVGDREDYPLMTGVGGAYHLLAWPE
jgi:hypothetical protein